MERSQCNRVFRVEISCADIWKWVSGRWWQHWKSMFRGWSSKIPQVNTKAYSGQRNITYIWTRLWKFVECCGQIQRWLHQHTACVCYDITQISQISAYSCLQNRHRLSSTLQRFIERVEQWQNVLRKRRKKRKEQFKLKESAELENKIESFTVILRYEQSTHYKEIFSYKNDTTSRNAKKLRLVYADIFARIIFQQGNRGSTIRGMTVEELQNLDKDNNGKLAICVKDQIGCLCSINCRRCKWVPGFTKNQSTRLALLEYQ